MAGDSHVVLDCVEKPGAIWATYELVRLLLGRNADHATAIDIEVVEPEGRMIYRNETCGTEFYYGQVEHVPNRCPNIRCDGRLGSMLGIVGQDLVMPVDAPDPHQRFTDAERRVYRPPTCPLCGAVVIPMWHQVGEQDDAWAVVTFRCPNWQDH